jgi:hypothetical protein
VAVFRTHRQAARANNRVLGLFFGAMAIVTLAFVVIVAGHYLTGWW